MAETKQIPVTTEVVTTENEITVFSYYNESALNNLLFFIASLIGSVGGLSFDEGELGYTREGYPDFNGSLSDQGELIVVDTSVDDYWVDGQGDLVYGDILLAPVVLAASGVEASEFAANWESVVGVTGYYLDVAYDSQFNTYVSGYQNKDVGDVLSHLVEGLSPGTNYYYRVRTTDGEVVSESSDSISVLTDSVFGIVTAKVGTFSMTLQGTGTVSIDWGDAVIEDYLLTGIDQIITHAYAAGGVLTITNPELITKIYINAMSITAFSNLDLTINLTYFDISGSTTTSYLGTTIDIQESWNLTNFTLAANNLTSLTTYATWTSITDFNLSYANITSLVFHTEWINLIRFNLTNLTALTSLTTFATWTSFIQITINGCTNLTSISTHSAWDLTYCSLTNTGLTSFTTYSTWTNLSQLNIINASLSSLITHPEWINLAIFSISNNNVSTITLHPEWVLITAITVSRNSLTSLTLHPEWILLTSIDGSVNTGITSVTVHTEWVLLNSIDFSECRLVALTMFASWIEMRWVNLHDNVNLATVNLESAWTELRTVDLNNNALTTLTTSNVWTKMTRLAAYTNSLTTFVAHQEWVLDTFLDLHTNAITVAVDINNILIEMDASGIVTGTIDLSGGTNAAPTGAGITAKNNLIGKGVSVSTN